MSRAITTAAAAINRTMRNAVDTAPSVRNLKRSLLEPDDVLELVEKALLDLLRFAADATQLAQRLLLLLGQIGGNHDPHKDQLVTATPGTHMRDATTVDSDRLAILRPGRNLDVLGTVDRWDFHRVAQGGLRHTQGQLVDDVGPVAFQHRVRLDLDDDVQVTRGASAGTDLAFTREADLRTTVDPGRDVDPHFLFAGTAAAATAGPAGLLDDLALAVATRAGRDIDDLSEDRLRGPPHLAGAAALRTGLRRGATFGAGPMAGRAGVGPRDGELALDAEYRFFEGQPQVESKVGAPPGTGPRASGGCLAKEHVEDVIDAAESSATDVETGDALGAGVAKIVVALPLGLVAQDLVGLVDLLEAGFRLRIVGIAVGVKLECELAIGTLQLFGAGCPRNAEDLVVVPLDRHTVVLGL